MSAVIQFPQSAIVPQGLIVDLDINAYHQGPGVSKSGLSEIARSPAHYYAKYLAPNRPAPKERAGQLEGSLAHCAVLEPDQFNKRYVVTPDDAPRRPSSAQREAKKPSAETLISIEYWDKFARENGNKRVITADQYETAMRQADSMRALPDIRALLDKGRPEVSAFWNDPVTGELCRCRPDWENPTTETGVIILDVKTYSDASPEEFARQIGRKGYHIQSSFYSDGYEIASEKTVHGFVFVAVETAYPYAACASMLDPTGITIGRDQYRDLLDVYARCRRTNLWPGYSDGIEVVSLPGYLTRGYE